MESQTVFVAEGKTYDWREILKEIGFKWCGPKKVWLLLKDPKTAGGEEALNEISKICMRMSGVVLKQEPLSKWKKYIDSEPPPKATPTPKAYWWNKDFD